MTLKDYETETLRRLVDEDIIGNNYRPIRIVCAKIRWSDMAQRYRIRKSCRQVLKHLETKGYVSSHGKSGDVYSLTELGWDYIDGLGSQTK